MVIQCDKCQSKFKLDDSKVTEKGVKVRCTKCKNIFTVKKETTPEENEIKEVPPTGVLDSASPPSEAVESSEGLGAETGEASQEGKEKPSAEETDTFALGDDEAPSADEEESPSSDGFGEMGGETETSDETFGFDEGTEERAAAEETATAEDDLASFDGFGLDEGTEERAAAEETATPEEELASFDGFGLDEGTEETAGEGTSDEGDQAFGMGDFGLDSEPSGMESSGPDAGAFGFEAEGEGLGFEETSPGELPDETSSFGLEDGSEKLSLDTGEGSASFGEFDLDEGEGSSEELEVEDSLLSHDSVELASEPEPPIADEIVQKKEKKKSFDEYPAKATGKRSKKKKPTLLILILLILAALGGGFYYLETSGKNITVGGVNLQTLIQEIKVQVGMVDTQKVEVKGLNGYYKTTKKEGPIFVVEGRAANAFNRPISFIKLKGTLYGNNGKALMTEVAYAGNNFSDNDLLEFSRSKVKDEMNYKVGKGLVNSNISPKKEIPFMIVFYNVPNNLAEFDVEVLSSEFVTKD
ncbi:MAG: zinc-ribbon domain-containing protein [Proteobacteria bacterium]|nr:zinc-ribbon domain-containing protein [Pseudomonadota bacterium]